MFPMMGMGSNGLGVAGGPNLGQGQVDPRVLAMLLSGGAGQSPGIGSGGTPLSPTGTTPMSQFIGAHGGGAGMPAAVGAGMGGPPMPSPSLGSPGGLPQPGAGGQMDIASILKTPQGLTALLNALKGNQTGLPPDPNQQPTGGIPPAPPGAPSNLTGPYSQGFGNVISQGLQSQQAPQQDFLQRLLASLGIGGGGGGGGAPNY